jgi:hypothetical protein
MPPLTDPERLRCYRNALGNWKFTGYVVIESRAWDWLRGNLPQPISQKEIARILHNYVNAGGMIDEQIETREPWKTFYAFHYDLRVQVANRRIYFETVLEYKDANDPDDPMIRVVNAHDA